MVCCEAFTLAIQSTLSPVQVMVELLQPKDGAQQDPRKPLLLLELVMMS